jgi:hypothetical protein
LIGTAAPIGVQQRDAHYRNLLRQQRMLTNRLKQSSISSASLSRETEEKVVSLFREAITKDLSERWKTSLDEMIKSRVASSQRDASVLVLERATQRLQSASSTVTARGFVNLVIGIVFALGALYVLRESVSLFTPEQLERLTIPQVMYLVGVRISLALIITLIAYFFLSLYRRSLEDAKYYQNEVTNIEARTSGLLTAAALKDPQTSTVVVNALMASGNSPAGDAELKTEAAREKLLLAVIEKLPQFKS